MSGGSVINALVAFLIPLQPLLPPDKTVLTVDDEIIKACVRFGVEPYFALQIAYRESTLRRYPPHSPHGAEGVMQLMPLTKRMYGVENAYDWRDNIRAGVEYLCDLQRTYKTPKLVYQHYTGTWKK